MNASSSTFSMGFGNSKRLRSYPKYKDSGVEWLGEIPAHWETSRLKFALSEPLKYGANEAAELDDPELPRFIRITDIDQNDGLRVDTFKSLPIEVAREYLLQEGDLLLARSGATAGKTFLYRNSWGMCAHAGYLIRARLNTDRNCPDFVRYFTASSSYWQWLSSVFIQATIQNVSADRYAGLVLPLPPKIEQRAIAVFLGRETAKIDALVAKKERLIELLQEKRTALITRAVTKGLDPNVPMKDSGVEWLGEIPAHWEVQPLSHASTKIGSGKTPHGGANSYVSDGVMLIRSQNVHFTGLRLDDVAFIDSQTDAEMSSSRVREGDVLLNMTGASLGRCCVATLKGFPANVNQHVCVIRSRPGAFESNFLNASLSARSVQAQIFNIENGISRDALNFEQVGRLRVARPPIDEQRAIADFLDRETANIDSLVTKVREAIELLKEYRTALISAAVTGKIDVRDEAV